MKVCNDFFQAFSFTKKETELLNEVVSLMEKGAKNFPSRDTDFFMVIDSIKNLFDTEKCCKKELALAKKQGKKIKNI